MYLQTTTMGEFEPDSDKIAALKKPGPVSGINLDYGQTQRKMRCREDED